ncbi:MAG: hypothetical protein QF898_20395 [SAR202 cluster bacterium]|jgi:hypothetical protein|nr:hypothetical protein [SAR202 cluster bacterium]MDP6512295.1 hypothetical protein [SAR202 cluster bacterium]MDP6714104.1 hypothetical protein [SAR202 cluster bacterium]
MANIEQLKEQYEGEWLAIAYDDYGTEGPQEGELIIHSLDEIVVWKAIKGDHRKIYVIYAGPLIDEDTAIAL